MSCRTPGEAEASSPVLATAPHDNLAQGMLATWVPETCQGGLSCRLVHDARKHHAMPGVRKHVNAQSTELFSRTADREIHRLASLSQWRSGMLSATVAQAAYLLSSRKMPLPRVVVLQA